MNWDEEEAQRAAEAREINKKFEVAKKLAMKHPIAGFIFGCLIDASLTSDQRRIAKEERVAAQTRTAQAAAEEWERQVREQAAAKARARRQHELEEARRLQEAQEGRRRAEAAAEERALREPDKEPEEVSYCPYCGDSSCSGGSSCPFLDDDD